MCIRDSLNGILLARYMEVEHFGIYILAYTTIILLAMPATMGLPNFLTRYISKYTVHKEFSLLRGLVTRTIQFVTITTLIIYGIAFLLYFLWWNQLESNLVNTVMIGFFLIPILGYGALRTAILRGFKYIVLAELPDTLLRNILFTICIVIALFADIGISPESAMMFQVIAASIGFIVGYIFYQRKILKKLKGITATYHTREWVKQTIPFTVNSGVQILKSKILIYVLAFFGSLEGVAIYEIATRGAALVTLILDAVNMAIAPFISSLYERLELKKLQRIVKKSSRIIFFISFPVVLVFIFGGEQFLILIFGEQYGVSFIPLLIIAIGQLVSALVGSVGLVLNMTGYQLILSRSNIMALTITSLVSIPMIIWFDVIGAAIVFSVVIILQNLYLFVCVRRKVRINTTIF